MLVIRLFRVGKKNQPSFKIVVIDKRKPPRRGRFIEEVGFLNPLTKEKVLRKERIDYWMSVGAKPSDTVHNLLVEEKIIEGKKIVKHKKAKKKEKKEEGKIPSQEEKPKEQKKEEKKEIQVPEEKVKEVSISKEPEEVSAPGEKKERQKQTKEASNTNKEEDKKEKTE